MMLRIEQVVFVRVIQSLKTRCSTAERDADYLSELLQVYRGDAALYMSIWTSWCLRSGPQCVRPKNLWSFRDLTGLTWMLSERNLSSW